MVPTHPNRSASARKAAANPKPHEIKLAREMGKLTQKDAAALIYCTERGWQQWENGDRKMHPAFWELFNLKMSSKGVPVTA